MWNLARVEVTAVWRGVGSCPGWSRSARSRQNCGWEANKQSTTRGIWACARTPSSCSRSHMMSVRVSGTAGAGCSCTAGRSLWTATARLPMCWLAGAVGAAAAAPGTANTAEAPIPAEACRAGEGTSPGWVAGGGVVCCRCRVSAAATMAAAKVRELVLSCSQSAGAPPASS